MIITEIIGNRIRHVSDSGLYIRQNETGNLYEDAVDIIPCPYTYIETDELIPEEEPTVEEKAEAYDILIGGDDDE